MLKRDFTMTEEDKQYIDDNIQQACRKLSSAKENLNSRKYVDAIQSSQFCIELSVKSILMLLEITFPKAHQWDFDKKPFTCIAQQIKKKKIISKLNEKNLIYSIPLPRFLFIMNFWGRFYLVAKYGFEEEFLASAERLLGQDEAEMATKHADECYRAVSELQNYFRSNDKL